MSGVSDDVQRIGAYWYVLRGATVLAGPYTNAREARSASR